MALPRRRVGRKAGADRCRDNIQDVCGVRVAHDVGSPAQRQLQMGAPKANSSQYQFAGRILMLKVLLCAELKSFSITT